MKIEIDMGIFDPNVYHPDKIELEGKAVAVYTGSDGEYLTSLIVISDDNMCKFPSSLLAAKSKAVVIPGSTSGSLRFEYEEGWILFWAKDGFDGLAKDRLLAEATILIADGRFLKGTPEMLGKYKIKAL